MCRSVEEKGVDPFSVDVDEIIATLRTCFPECESPEELALDAEAVQYLASVIQNQGDWVKHRSTSLYTDPFLLEDKIKRLNKDELAKLFASVWNPIIEMEQLSIPALAEAREYWVELLPISERWQRFSSAEQGAEATTLEELIKLRILAEKTFKEELELFWKELLKRVKEKKEMRYWDFVGAETYSETLKRAYMTSFLVTYGYATLELQPLEEEVFIKPLAKPRTGADNIGMVSVPLSITYEEWLRWKEGKTT